LTEEETAAIDALKEMLNEVAKEGEAWRPAMHSML
jgi:hypothetical protein